MLLRLEKTSKIDEKDSPHITASMMKALSMNIYAFEPPSAGGSSGLPASASSPDGQGEVPRKIRSAVLPTYMLFRSPRTFDALSVVASTFERRRLDPLSLS